MTTSRYIRTDRYKGVKFKCQGTLILRVESTDGQEGEGAWLVPEVF